MREAHKHNNVTMVKAERVEVEVEVKSCVMSGGVDGTA